jgi:hypothetical protein
MRVGSTWLGAMLAEPKGHLLWREPMVGELVGSFFYNLGLRWNEYTTPYQYKDFIFSAPTKKTWLNSIRSLVIDAVETRFPKLPHRQCLIIQEPTGSVGAPWLIEALPESRMIFLIRDPRDVVASMLDAYKKGGWFYAEQYLVPYKFRDEEYLIDREQQEKWLDSLADTRPTAFVEERARIYLRDIGNVKQAYDHHRGHKVLVRYEDLRADTLGTIKHICSALDLAVENEELTQMVDKHAWENISEDKKGQGKVRRKATPGGWREDLTPEQVETVERITHPLLEEFYSK